MQFLPLYWCNKRLIKWSTRTIIYFNSLHLYTKRHRFNRNRGHHPNWKLNPPGKPWDCCWNPPKPPCEPPKKLWKIMFGSISEEKGLKDIKKIKFQIKHCLWCSKLRRWLGQNPSLIFISLPVCSSAPYRFFSPFFCIDNTHSAPFALFVYSHSFIYHKATPQLQELFCIPMKCSTD